jgi:hypothetical protein
VADLRYGERFREALINPAWEECVERDPLLAFSFYLSGRVAVLCTFANEIMDNLDAGFSVAPIDGGRIDRAESLMWFWLLGAYEVVRTMDQAKACFSARLAGELHQLKQLLAATRMPAAKMEKAGKKVPVNSNRVLPGGILGTGIFS